MLKIPLLLPTAIILHKLEKSIVKKLFYHVCLGDL